MNQRKRFDVPPIKPFFISFKPAGTLCFLFNASTSPVRPFKRTCGFSDFFLVYQANKKSFERTVDIMDKRIGTITIIVTDRTNQAQKINKILCDFGDMIIGRMGLPYPPGNLHVISLIVHATTDQIGALTGKLGTLPGVSVKSSLTKI